MTRVEELTQEVNRLRRFLDYTVRSWLAEGNEHSGCNNLCPHKDVQDIRFTLLEDILREEEEK